VVPLLYNRVDPRLAGVPFFVWYQFALILVGGVVTGVVYLLRGTESAVAPRHDAPPADRPAGGGSR
ncbi:MAG: DUF3311 domain-containing protein, partial [Acidimicrobiales bacterium]